MNKHFITYSDIDAVRGCDRMRRLTRV